MPRGNDKSFSIKLHTTHSAHNALMKPKYTKGNKKRLKDDEAFVIGKIFKWNLFFFVIQYFQDTLLELLHMKQLGSWTKIMTQSMMEYENFLFCNVCCNDDFLVSSFYLCFRNRNLNSWKTFVPKRKMKFHLVSNRMSFWRFWHVEIGPHGGRFKSVSARFTKQLASLMVAFTFH